MSWPLFVLGKILAGNIAASWIFRSLGRPPKRRFTERLVVQYLITFSCATAYFLLSGLPLTREVLMRMLPVFCVGSLGSAGLYFTMRAKAISLSRTAVFEMLVAVIPITLSAVLLGEWIVFKNDLMLVGFALALVGVALYFVYDLSSRAEGGATSVPLVFYGYGIAFMFTAGITAFLMNVWAKSSIPAPEFLLAWYTGTLVGSSIYYSTFRAMRKKQDDATNEFVMSRPREWLLVCAGGIVVFANMYFLFGSFQRAPLLVVAPFYITADIFGPVLVGMLFFKEWRTLRRWGYVFFGMDLVGTCIVALARLLSP